MTENDIAKMVVNATYQIYTKLGPGLLESVYERILVHELKKLGLKVSVQQDVDIIWDEIVFEAAFRADMVVEDNDVIELKALEQTAKIHKRQTLTYVRLTGKRLGLLINLGAESWSEVVTRVVNGLPE
ncbi:MAG: GxxExxY protein [Planctomycetes bacterium]|nr:GxxExxY protein [Planctomycetota bacterium]